jgi:hypothetical protein
VVDDAALGSAPSGGGAAARGGGGSGSGLAGKPRGQCHGVLSCAEARAGREGRAPAARGFARATGLAGMGARHISNRLRALAVPRCRAAGTAAPCWRMLLCLCLGTVSTRIGRRGVGSRQPERGGCSARPFPRPREVRTARVRRQQRRAHRRGHARRNDPAAAFRQPCGRSGAPEGRKSHAADAGLVSWWMLKGPRVLGRVLNRIDWEHQSEGTELGIWGGDRGRVGREGARGKTCYPPSLGPLY